LDWDRSQLRQYFSGELEPIFMHKPIVVVGSINLDLVVGADHIPQPGETITGNSFNTFFGGKGANQAVAVAKLGHPVFMVGNVGDDGFGQQLRQALNDVEVETRCVCTVAGSSGVALITVASGGENNIVIVPGANATLTPQSLEKSNSVLLQAGFILAQLEIPLETVEYLAGFAERNKIPLMLDPAPARELPTSLLKKTTWLTPNETETEGLLNMGLLGDDEAAALGVADQLLALGPQNVLLKLGSRGCLVAQRNQAKQFVPAFNVNPVDTTAAGDAFNGAFAIGLLRGKTAVQSAQFACAVAAISVTRPGAQPSMPTAQEVEMFLKQQNLAN
jgi:ribokinase